MRNLLVCAALFTATAFGPAVLAQQQCPASGPALLAPTQSPVPYGAVTFEWTSVQYATSYSLYVGIDGDTPSNKANVAGTGKTVIIEPGRNVSWFVKANAAACNSMASGTVNFYTSCPEEVPVIGRPDQGTVFEQGETITFEWSAVGGAAGYDVQVTPDFGQTWQTIIENHEATSFSTNTLGEGDWGWTVRANFNGQCSPAYAEPSNFLVTAQCPSAPPTLEFPAAQAVLESPIDFRWSDIDGAGFYRLWAKSTDGSPQLLATTVRNRVDDQVLPPGTWAWWVVADLGDCGELKSSFRALTVEDSGSGCPANPDKAMLLSPADDATGLSSPVTFKWSAVPGATSYRVLGALDGGSAVSLGETTATSLTASLPAGSGYWLVQTFFGDGCPTTLSERWELTVTTGAQCSDAAPQLSYPPNGAANVDSKVRFEWTAVPNAIAYVLYAAADDNELAYYGKTEETSIERLVPAGRIRWMVVALFNGCPETRSAVAQFDSGSPADCPDGEITLLAPADGASQASPVLLQWTPVAGVEAYRVWASADGSAPIIVARTTEPAATVNLPAGDVEWWVDALRGDCPAIVSDEGRFLVTGGANCQNNPAPVIVSPVGSENDPVDVVNPVTLSWSAAAGAIGYRVFISEDGAPFEDLKVTTQTSVVLDLDDGSWAWFVEALYEGCRGVGSALGYFDVERTEPRCSEDEPVVIGPSEGTAVSSPVTFSWTEVENADAYRILLAFDGGEPSLLAITTDTTITRALPPGTFVWVVEAVLRECPSTASSRTEFTVIRSQNCGEEAPALISPPDGAHEVVTPVDFVWTPVSGAVRYALVVRAEDGAPTVVGTTEDHQLRRRVPPGAIEWWVIAYFAGCDPRESAHFEFETSHDEECDNGRPVLLFPQSEREPVSSPVRFVWMPVANAIGYNVWVTQGEEAPSIVASTHESHAVAGLSEGPWIWYVEALFENCPSEESARGQFIVGADEACGTPRKPRAQIVGKAMSGLPYQLRWTPLPNVSFYEIQESPFANFAMAETFRTGETAHSFSHIVNDAPVQYRYRVRAVSDCNDEPGPFSSIVGVFVVPQESTSTSVEAGINEVIVQRLFLEGGEQPVQFTASVDRPWMMVSPQSGVIPPEGITLFVTADPWYLSLGTNTGTVTVNYPGTAGSVTTHGSTPASFPMSVSLVTPVTPGGKGTPPPDALIFPGVGHAIGGNDSLFESDVRITNIGAQIAKYELYFTPLATEGTTSGSSSTIEVAPNETIALDDIVSSLFGTGTVSSAIGTLEVRPVTTSNGTSSLFGTTTGLLEQLTTVASSRTYNFTPEGTFGQFVPAIPFSKFVGKALDGEPSTILALQQVAQSEAYRTNFGFVEAAGLPADLVVRVYDTTNNLLDTIPVSLRAGEHLMYNSWLRDRGITSLSDGRVEVEVVGGEGKVTAYVSSVDNLTNDPLLMSARVKGEVLADRYVIPGAAYVDNGAAFWVTDLRVFNSGATATPATLIYYPAVGEPITRDITLDPGEIEVIDNVLGGLFAQPSNAGGALAVTTPQPAPLIVTARTYNETGEGTYGQLVEGVTAAESVGAGDRALQILQVEQSTRIRTNIAVTETSGQAATVEVSAVIPGSLATPVITLELDPYEFLQFPMSNFNIGDALYNGRVTVKVVGGAGRITAAGSAIDQITQDPTLIPAQ